MKGLSVTGGLCVDLRCSPFACEQGGDLLRTHSLLL